MHNLLLCAIVLGLVYNMFFYSFYFDDRGQFVARARKKPGRLKKRAKKRSRERGATVLLSFCFQGNI